MEDFLAPLVRYIRSNPAVSILNSETADRPPVLGPPSLPPATGITVPSIEKSQLWVFRTFDSNGAPYANVEGSGVCSITLQHSGNWTSPNRGNRLRFPEVTVYYHCDPTRLNFLGAPSSYDARAKCFAIHKEVSKLLHLVDKGTGGFLKVGGDAEHKPLMLVSSHMSQDVQIYPVDFGDGMIEGRAVFDLEMVW